MYYLNSAAGKDLTKIFERYGLFTESEKVFQQMYTNIAIIIGMVLLVIYTAPKVKGWLWKDKKHFSARVLLLVLFFLWSIILLFLNMMMLIYEHLLFVTALLMCRTLLITTILSLLVLLAILKVSKMKRSDN